MKRFVLDASVALRCFLYDPVSPYAKRVKQFLIKAGRAVVPALWHLEMSNGLAVVVTSGVFVSARQALVTARAFQLFAYEAVYLDLARRERLALASLDERLRVAAEQAGVELLR